MRIIEAAFALPGLILLVVVTIVLVGAPFGIGRGTCQGRQQCVRKTRV